MTPWLWLASILAAGALLGQVIAWVMLGDADWTFVGMCAGALLAAGALLLDRGRV